MKVQQFVAMFVQITQFIWENVWYAVIEASEYRRSVAEWVEGVGLQFLVWSNMVDRNHCIVQNFKILEKFLKVGQNWVENYEQKLGIAVETLTV
jgi:hypothetical protein